MTKILLIDDEVRMLDLLELYLEPIGFLCDKVNSGEAALEKIKNNKYEVILLDVMMPVISGFQVCKQVRTFSAVPIIMLTAREAKEDVVKGLKLGADDYITKPFNEEELVARIHSVLRRSGQESSIEINQLVWDESTHELKYMGRTIPLTLKEFSIIGYLMKNPNRVYSREHLIDLIWGMNAETERRTIDSHVRNMREKVRRSGFPIDTHLKTVWGVGYKWVNE
jgi:DNA-binding response OmpR family regulator